MYLIRADAARQLVDVTFEAHVSSAEALRAISHAATLAQAGDLRAMLVDVRAVERGPGRWMQLAAAIALHCPPGLRVAIVAGEAQQAAVRRIIRRSGVRRAFRGFSRPEPAEQWATTPATAAARSRPSARGGAPAADEGARDAAA